MKGPPKRTRVQGDAPTVHPSTELPNRSKDGLDGELIFRLKVERSVRHPSAVTN